MKKNNVIGFLIKALLVLFLIFGFCSANLWRLTPTFSYLETCWTFPLVEQLVLLGAAVVSIIFSKKVNRLLIAIATLITIVSWYAIIASYSTNSIRSSLAGFALTESQFKDMKTIEFNRFSFDVAEQAVTRNFVVGFFPFGLPYDQIKRHLLDGGICLEFDAKDCRIVEVVWP